MLRSTLTVLAPRKPARIDSRGGVFYALDITKNQAAACVGNGNSQGAELLINENPPHRNAKIVHV